MDSLNELIDEIRSKHNGSLLASEFYQYLGRYNKYYDQNVSAHPRQGFMACMTWDAERRKEFDKQFKKLKLNVVEDPIEKLHDYDLNQSGMNRLRELESKIKQA